MSRPALIVQGYPLFVLVAPRNDAEPVYAGAVVGWFNGEPVAAPLDLDPLEGPMGAQIVDTMSCLVTYSTDQGDIRRLSAAERRERERGDLTALGKPARLFDPDAR